MCHAPAVKVDTHSNPDARKIKGLRVLGWGEAFGYPSKIIGNISYEI